MQIEPFEVQVKQEGRTLIKFQTHWTAIIGKGNATTLCTSDDVTLRVALASRVQLYLDNLIETIISDTAGQLSKSDIEDMILRLNAAAKIITQCKAPSTVQEIFDRLKGDGNG